MTGFEGRFVSGGGRSATLLCTSLMGGEVAEMMTGMKRAVEVGADVVEIRLDCLNDWDPHSHLQLLVKESSLPTIFSCRLRKNCSENSWRNMREKED